MVAPTKIMTNISKGCAFTLFEKISGCKTMLSIAWTAAKTEKTLTIKMMFSLLNEKSPEVLKATKIPKLPPSNGPKYGIKLAMAAKTAIVTA